MTILRASSFGSVEWTRSLDGTWTGGLVQETKETKDKDVADAAASEA